jgi:hypothetical protein
MIQKILPQMVNSEETVKFIDENLDDSEKLILRVTMGSLYNVFNGVFTGIYMCIYVINYHHIHMYEYTNIFIFIYMHVYLLVSVTMGNLYNVFNGVLTGILLCVRYRHIHMCKKKNTYHICYFYSIIFAIYMSF